MCDACSDFLQLLASYEAKISNDNNEQPPLTQRDVHVVFVYIQTWPNRQCMCCFRDPKNLERFNYVTQGVIFLAAKELKQLADQDVSQITVKTEETNEPPCKNPEDEKENLEVVERDKLLILCSKIFLLNFPLYVAYKHTIQNKLDELSQQEMQNLNLFCDLHDSEIPIYLLKNVSWFCKLGGLGAMTNCFTNLSPEMLPVSTAHSMISIVCNLKLWMNYKSMVSLMVPLRSCVLRYMCKLSDQDLRTPTIKSMADFMWNAIKDPLDTPVAFDVDGLDLAFKYFTSSTLTMRLAGITQINNQIGVLAEICVGETMPEAESAPRHMADWLINNNIISHIFGPNLHVEVIKQSHIILNFLAMEGRITCDHMDLIWAAAQLKHCAKPVHDLLPGLVKHLAAAPTLHLYSLLTKLEPKEHTEQTLYLSSALIKAVWSRGGGASELGLIKVTAANVGLHKCTTSSENSVSIDGTNSEEEHGESSVQSESHKSDSEDIEGVEIEEEDGTHMVVDSNEPPCKLARKQLMDGVHCDGSSTDTELDGIPIKTSPTKPKWTASSKLKNEKRAHLRKKILSKINALPEGVENIASSTSQDEADVEDSPSRLKKRKKLLRKTRVKRRKVSLKLFISTGNHKKINRATLIETLNDVDVDSDHDIKIPVKGVTTNVLVLPTPLTNVIKCKPSSVYLEDSSSCSELGKEGQEASCANFLTLHPRTEHILEMLSGEEAEVEGDAEGSYSSRMSNKSEKNMGDFDGEDSICEEELARLANHVSHVNNMNIHALARSPEKSPVRVDPRLSACFKADNVCQPGNTLLWDLLQDDKICQLGEGLALEAEKTLCNLICYTPDKEIRMKFIEGCLNNLANNLSVVISLRLLPKLLTSFRGLDMHQVTHWAERQHHMMTHFFNNLKTYTSNPCKSLSLYTHQMQVQVRLHFLSAVFSPLVSSNNFKLSTEQVDILWECLAHDPECSDELFSWLLSQTKTTELHALKLDALRRLYTHHLPSLPPEKFSMICLSLFQQLCTLSHLLAPDGEEQKKWDRNVGMDHMWKIALKACNTEVSMAAIQYINSYYMGQNLQHESQFVCQCMTHVQAATDDLISGNNSTEDSCLMCIQRALILMKTHIESFRRRYAYHLRKWALEGKAITSHSASLGERSSTPIRLVVQAGSSTERCGFDMLHSDYIADLRAEIVKWCEGIQQMKNEEVDVNKLTKGGDTWIRIITQGQELTIDCDEKTIGEIGFKENQIIYTSYGMSRNMKKREYMDAPSLQPAPPRECLPTLLLLQPTYFEQLFSLMHSLSCMKIQIKGRKIPHTKAQVLSRRVWEILSLLPTSPKLLQGFQQLNVPLTELLDPSSAQKLMYTLYIVESLSINQVKTSEDEESWVKRFVQHGGLKYLFDIFMSGVLQREGGDGSDWQQDCLASLLKILSQLGLEPVIKENRPTRNDKIVIPNLNEALLSLIDVKSTMAKLTGILEQASMPKDPNHYKTGFWGRAQVVHYAMALLVSWLHCSEEARNELFQSQSFSDWLKRLVLEDPELAVRREVCSAIYRLCLGVSAKGETMQSSFIAQMLSQLLSFLDKAERMRPPKIEAIQITEDGKEPYGPACRDYFWLVSRLIDSLPENLVKESIEEPEKCIIDINALSHRISRSILTRDFYELRHRTVDDDGLIGLLNLLTNLLKHRPPFQAEKEAQELLIEIFNFLFALPTPKLRQVPKCKSARARSGAFDLLIELVKRSPKNYAVLHERLLKQHQPGPNSPYPWDYWPHEDGRSECGYVGLTNLGATCYMASCMQHLYMMPQARAAILTTNTEQAKHEPTLRELQRMFAYLLESERKAYNPRSFCKVYTMDHQPLNTAEQKDMAEFFIDLVSKLEEMTPTLKEMVKKLFCGVISNNVVSLDCDHVSRTLEEFYTVRCQVADMRNLYESLDEVTVKDTLEGDNMYTCSQCGKKVRAEKRACFKKLPRILCFNTMRYTFNMLTMLKEKVNTHFSFPLRLNMAGYVEKTLMPQHYREEKVKNVDPEEEQYEYDLIGVTVHTGTADGGHYYSFIKDRTTSSRDKWFFFNDAEVKPFDPNQIAAECFGGEMTSKTYDSVTDKFMDFSFEKTNSAYMLFYERCPLDDSVHSESSSTTFDSAENGLNSPSLPPSPVPTNIELSKELEDWIFQDNMRFIQDKNIFEHTYFNFMWQICGYIPQTIMPLQSDITQKSAQLSTTFFLETYIHAKEKPTMVQWVELVTKQFNASQEACVWFLEHMSQNTWWPVQVLLKCSNQIVRQMFQRLCIHVIQRLKQSQSSLYLELNGENDTKQEDDRSNGNEAATSNGILVNNSTSPSCVTKFIKMLLSLMEQGAKPHLKHLTEYFAFLYDFSKMGEEESKFLLDIGAINTMVHFYLGQKVNDFVDVSEGEEEEEVVPIPAEKYKPASLDKMITLVASLVEKSRDSDMNLQLSEKDYSAVAGGKGFTFLYQQIKDNINLQQTRNLIHSLCLGNNQLAQSVVCTISQAITRHAEGCQPFFKILTLLTENNNQTNASQPCFTQLVLQKVWEAAECCPYTALDWLALQVTRNRMVHSWVLNSMDSWLEHFLMAHNNQRVRNTAAYLLASLVPSTSFRQGFQATHRRPREPQLSVEAQAVLHQIYTALLRLLPSAKHYIDIQTHGAMKLSTYFALMTYCCVSRTEKLMFGQYFPPLWHLFHPKLSEPSIPAYHNKQALLGFWNHVCTDCPENVQLMLQNAYVTKNIAFNYILADHDDQEIVMYNRSMLPAYYGLLRMMCQQSKVFTRSLAQHQNLQWAFKNITPHPNQYPQAVEELFKLMQLMVANHPDSTEAEQREIYTFRRATLMTYLQCLDGRANWSTLISAFRILVDSSDDKLYVVYNGGLQTVFECFQHLHVMLHEATAVQISGDMLDILTIMHDLLLCIRMYRDSKDARNLILNTKEWVEVLRKLATLLNTYNPPEMRQLCLDVLKEFVVLITPETMQILVPLLSHCHSAFQDSQDAVPLGPYFPRRGHVLPVVAGKGAARPVRPMVQMTVPHNQLESSRGVDPEYDEALDKFYGPYHDFIDMMFRLAVNNESVPEVLVNLSAVVGFEAVPLHSTFFPKLWLDILKTQHIDRKYINMLTSCNYFVDYVDAILLDERGALTVDIIYEFLTAFFPKVSAHVLSEQTLTLIDNTVVTLDEQLDSFDLVKIGRRLSGDLRALILVYNSPEAAVPARLKTTLKKIQAKVKQEIINLDEKAEKTEEKNNCKKSRSEDESSCSKDKESSEDASNSNNNKEKSDSDTEMQSTSCSDKSNMEDKKEKRCRPLEDVQFLDRTINELIEVTEKNT